MLSWRHRNKQYRRCCKNTPESKCDFILLLTNSLTWGIIAFQLCLPLLLTRFDFTSNEPFFGFTYTPFNQDDLRPHMAKTKLFKYRIQHYQRCIQSTMRHEI